LGFCYRLVGDENDTSSVYGRREREDNIGGTEPPLTPLGTIKEKKEKKETKRLDDCL